MHHHGVRAVTDRKALIERLHEAAGEAVVDRGDHQMMDLFTEAAATPGRRLTGTVR